MVRLRRDDLGVTVLPSRPARQRMPLRGCHGDPLQNYEAEAARPTRSQRTPGECLDRPPSVGESIPL